MLLEIVFVVTSAAICFADPILIQPCYLNHYKCIGKYLASNSKCSRDIKGYVDSEYVIPRSRFETPFFNATYIDRDLIVRNHNGCFVSELITNPATKRTIFSVDCPWLNFESTRTLIQHKSYSEDTMFHYAINGTYPLIRLTATFPSNRPIDICNAFVYAEVTELPIFHIDPKDKPTAKFLSRDLTKLHIYERETFFYRGRWLFRTFVNKVLCNFGCDL